MASREPKHEIVQKEGEIAVEKGRYYVTVGETRIEIPTGQHIGAEDVRKLIGKKVMVTLAGPNIVALGKPPRIICYIPASEILRKVRPEVQEFLKAKYAEMGIRL
jgi:hypothetical protein